VPPLVTRLLARFPPKPVPCPCCRLLIEAEHVFGYRSCAACGASLRLRRRQFVTLYLLAMVVSVLLAYMAGNRDLALGALATLLWMPTFFAMVVISLRLFPLDVGVVAPGWTPGDAEADQDIARRFEALRKVDAVIGSKEHDTVQLTEDESTGRVRLPLSAPRKGSLTFEAVALILAAVALVLFALYVALEPHF
jgi:hypothetical protein